MDISCKKCSCDQNVTTQRLTEFVCVWRGIIYFVSVVGGFDCPQYLIYICIAETLHGNTNTTQCSAVQLPCWRHKSANPFVCCPQNFEMIHVEFHLFLKVHPTFTFRVKTGEKSAYLVCLAKRLTRTHRVWEPDNFLGKSPWKDICIFITWGEVLKETLEYHSSKIHQFISDS